MTRRQDLVTAPALLAVASLLIGCQAQPPTPAPEPQASAAHRAAAEAEPPQPEDPAARAEHEREAAEAALKQAEHRVLVANAKIKRFLASNPLEVISEPSNETAIRIQQLIIKRNEINKLLEQLTLQHHLLQSENQDDQFPNQQARAENTAKLQQVALGQKILASELSSVNESLKEWDKYRKKSIRLLQEYESIQRELDEAESERESAQQALQSLNG